MVYNHDPLEPAVMLWMDFEFDTLETDAAHILEVACVATDRRLVNIGESFVGVSCPSGFREEDMDKSIRSMHRDSGLLSDMSETDLSERELEGVLLKWIDRVAGNGPLVHCGFYIQADREIVKRVMPQLYSRLSFRQLDLRTLEEAADAWTESGRFSRLGRRSHRALKDVKDAIALARMYGKQYFGLP